MPQKYVIGVDGGGSKTAAVVLDAAGQVHGRATTGSVNHHNVGLEQAEANLVQVMELALADAGLNPADLAAAAWALAGVDRPSERQLFEALANRLWPAIPIRVENDALAALVAGVGLTPGVTLIAGTGMIAYGRAADGRRARAGGWGYLFDVGSGYYLVRSALRRLSQAFDQGNMPPSPLLPALLGATKTAAVPELLAWMYGRARPIADIAALAPLVLNAAEQTDLLALATVNEGAGALARAVRDVAQQLGFHEPFPLVYSGGLLMRSAYYRGLPRLAPGRCCRRPAAAASPTATARSLGHRNGQCPRA
jgi:N-acetylglucosamine kinase-like BadF-type ATPase